VDRRLSDRIGIAGAWLSGGALLAVLAGLIAWLAVKGLQNVDWAFVTSNPLPGSLEQGVTGGILAPLVGTLTVVVLGAVVAVPLGVATALFLSEYRSPRWLAHVADISVDLIFGVPSIVFALFGLAIFIRPDLVFLSHRVESSGNAAGASFICASLMMSLIAFPPIVRASQAAMGAVPQVQREAAYALGKGRLATIRRIVLPGARNGIATGAILGLGRIAGDTGIVWLLLGGTVLAPPDAGWWRPDNWLRTLQSEGSTLTSYVYYASPAGDGNSPGKAYGAALVLMLMTLVLNALVRLAARRRKR